MEPVPFSQPNESCTVGRLIRCLHICTAHKPNIEWLATAWTGCRLPEMNRFTIRKNTKNKKPSSCIYIATMDTPVAVGIGRSASRCSSNNNNWLIFLSLTVLIEFSQFTSQNPAWQLTFFDPSLPPIFAIIPDIRAHFIVMWRKIGIDGHLEMVRI